MGSSQNIQYVLFGCGKNFYSYLERLRLNYQISYYSDNNVQMRVKYRDKCNLNEIAPEDISSLENPCVVITVENEEYIVQIKKQFEEQGIECCHVRELLDSLDIQPGEINWPQAIHEDRIFRFIDIDLEETTTCNFRCKYCYVWRKKGFEGNIKTSIHSLEEIKKGLSKDVLGGTCFINLCARGETLLSDKIVELTRVLLSEGHYVSIVTNGTVRKNILKILEFPIELQERMFFKISFHYHELEERSLMEIFWENISSIRNSSCSYTLEITPYDDLIKDIEQIKNLFEEKEMGAMPHISFARDSKKQDLDVLSQLPIEEYKSIWGQFESKMFALKSEWYGKKIDKFCYAGNWSYRINLSNGSIQNCYRHESIGNIFDSNMKSYPVCTIEHDCNMAYCFNNHAFLAWGCVPEIDTYTYLDMRDRERKNGTHWISDKMMRAMRTKLAEEHFEYANKWDDYRKLFERTERPAIILFNSPDYRNLGDHAIALAEKKFFEKNYKDYDFIEVSCEQYIKENSIIRNYVHNDDIVVITGGGNFGTMWLWIYDLSLNIIQSFPNNKIVILPQSIHFENSCFGKKEALRAKIILEKHGNITFCLRDKSSFDMADRLFGTSVCKLYIPDFVIGLNFEINEKRSGIGMCLRKDKERKALDEDKLMKIIEQIGEGTTEFSTISDKDISLNNRETHLQELLKSISGYKLVITDRLHAMIFCAITQTPCVAFDNSYGKVSGVYEWIKDLPYIEYCADVKELEFKVKEVLEATVEEHSLCEIREKLNELIQNLF